MEGCGRGGGIRADGSWWYSGIDGGGGGGGDSGRFSRVPRRAILKTALVHKTHTCSLYRSNACNIPRQNLENICTHLPFLQTFDGFLLA